MTSVMRRCLVIISTCVVSLALVQGAAAYEEIPVAEGGRLTGMVLLDGKVPGPNSTFSTKSAKFMSATAIP